MNAVQILAQELGGLLNTALSVFPCPDCREKNGIDVHERGVRFRCCSHLEPLPPLHSNQALKRKGADRCAS